MSVVLDRIDAAIKKLCACPCRRPITDASPSAYFTSEVCQQRWHALRVIPARAVQAMRAAAARVAEELQRLLARLVEAFQPMVEAFNQLTQQLAAPLPPRHGPARPRRAPRTIRPTRGWTSRRA